MSEHFQRIYLDELQNEDIKKKQTRNELRSLKDSYVLKKDFAEVPTKYKSDVKTDRVGVYCTAESYNLKTLLRMLRSNSINVRMYAGECLHCEYKTKDIYFLEYGVMVAWGLSHEDEHKILKLISSSEINPLDQKQVETEEFEYGITDTSQIVNDCIYLVEENIYVKMVLSAGIAQSVKLDYFEDLVDSTIMNVKDLPEEIGRETSRSRQDILNILAKLYTLSFDLNLISNVIEEPAFLWDYDAYSSVYETCIKYLDVQERTATLNNKFKVLQNVLGLINENIATQNSEKLESKIAFLTIIYIIIAVCQFVIIFYAIFFLLLPFINK